MKETVFYRCEICGNLICMIEDSGNIPRCCGKEMQKLIRSEKEAFAEKHLPIVSRVGSHLYVHVGMVAHPMLDTHRIVWIAVQTDCGLYFHWLKAGGSAETEFRVDKNEQVECVYAYCNMHGLWGRCFSKDHMEKDRT